MQHQIFKKILTILLALVFSAAATNNVAFAQISSTADCSSVNYGSGNVTVTTLVCPLLLTINILMLSAGAVFVVMIFVGVYKFAVSAGDPQIIAGARNTLTWAVTGFIVIVMAFTIIGLVGNTLGADGTTMGTTAIFDAWITTLNDFFCLSNKIPGC
ncbi:MAG: hypothetical protein R3B92_01615 [Patescibacteria group bacterium]|uniref:TrbC/VIRB2 family protein n=1 Tax=candidate division WWE3 bacterium TaxID=2053526 RepID=A0A955J1D7_UNCKA|nr:hypothetical protein [candidate division WWE3 bacterium]